MVVSNAVIRNVRQKTHGTVHVKIMDYKTTGSMLKSEQWYFSALFLFLNAATQSHGVSLKKSIDTLHQLS